MKRLADVVAAFGAPEARRRSAGAHPRAAGDRSGGIHDRPRGRRGDRPPRRRLARRPLAARRRDGAADRRPRVGRRLARTCACRRAAGRARLARGERDPALPLPRDARPKASPNVTVVHARAEEWTDGLGAHDLVTARALASLNVDPRVRRAAPAPRAATSWPGRASSRRRKRPTAPRPPSSSRSSPSPSSRSSRSARPAAEPSTSSARPAPTPPRFPRRPGMATKRPLRAT